MISGNSLGVEFYDSGTLGSMVEGNLIGLGADGETMVGNTSVGIELVSAQNVTIGGTAAGAGNVISGNASYGVAVVDAASST